MQIVYYVLASVSDGYRPRRRMGTKEKAEAGARSPGMRSLRVRNGSFQLWAFIVIGIYVHKMNLLFFFEVMWQKIRVKC